MTRRTTTGRCNLCGGAFSKAAITRHLKSCEQSDDSSRPSSGRKARKTGSFHLVVEGRYLPQYWMHLEVPANAELEDLDGFLRQIWLECCDHMSQFEVEGRRYSFAPMADYNGQSMDIKLKEILHPGLKFYHEYDFGSSTHLSLKVVSEQETEIKDRSIRVLARNEPPPITCQSCGEIGTQICAECIYSGKGLLCDKCAAEHECGEEMLLPVVNSPRVGVCGYTG